MGTTFYSKDNLKAVFAIFAASLIGIFSALKTFETLAIAVTVIALAAVFVLSVAYGKSIGTKLLLLLLMCIFIFPGVKFAGLSLRLDDGVAVLVTIVLATLVYLEGIQNSKLVNVIFIYLAYCLGITVISVLFKGLDLVYVLYFVKEIQYFIYFYAFMHLTIKRPMFFKTAIKFMFFLALLTVLYGVYQLISGSYAGFYGVGIISESSPSQSGGIYLFISLYFLYLFQKRKAFLKRAAHLLLFITSFSLTFATVSRTSILSLCTVMLVFTLIQAIHKRIKIKAVIISVYLAVPLGLISLPLLGGMVDRIKYRLSDLGGGSNIRGEKWQYLLSQVDTTEKLFGIGKGGIQKVLNSFTLATDSMYVRQIIEIGVLGTLLWLVVIGSILLFSFKRLKNNYPESMLVILLTCSFLIMSVTHEVFLVAIQASIYWCVVGLFIGKIYSNILTKSP